MEPYEKEAERVRLKLETPSSELGDVNSDYSDITDEYLMNNSEDDGNSEVSDTPNVDEVLIEFEHNDLYNEPGPRVPDETMDLSVILPDENGKSDAENATNMSKSVPVFVDPTYIGWNKPIPAEWSSTPQPRPSTTRGHKLVTHLPGPKKQARNAKREIECWNLFFPESMIEKLVHYTNKKIRQVQENYARARDAKETDVCEIKAMIGLLYLAGLTTSAKQSPYDLWRKDGLGVEIFRLIMGVNRFKFLLQHLRFDDIASADRQQRKELDKLYCFREFFEDFSQRCNGNYNHSSYVTIDEMRPKFCGKSGSHVNMPKKPGKLGIKVWAVTDSKTFYTSNLEVLVANQNKGPFFVSTSARNVVNRMVSHIQGTGRNITCGSFFTSVPVARDLLKKQLTLVGKIRKNSIDIPLELITEDKENKRPIKSSMFAFTSDATLVSYKATDDKFVVLLSTLHERDGIEETSGKPAIITFYNKNKCGVDVSEAMQNEYSVAGISNRWPLTLFFFLLNVGGVNAFVIWKANNVATNGNSKTPRKEFLENIGRELILEHARRRIVDEYPLAKPMKARLIQIFNFQPARPGPQDPVQRGRYNVCGICPRRKNRKTIVTCNSCYTPICREHTRPACVYCADRDQAQHDGEEDED